MPLRPCALLIATSTPVGYFRPRPTVVMVTDGCCARLDRQLIYQSSVGVKAPAGGTPTLIRNPQEGACPRRSRSLPPARRCSWTGRGDPADPARPTTPPARRPA